MIVDKEELIVTTHDNPFDPYEEYEDWERYDQTKGYNTMQYVARLAMLNNPTVLPTHLKEADFEKAMKELVESQPLVYKLIHKVVQVEDYTLID